jgi:hypothetical protein
MKAYPLTESKMAGSLIGAVALIAAVMTALLLSGRFEAFSRDHGLLQFLVVLPSVSLFTGLVLSATGTLTRSQMIWAVAPVEIVLLIGSGVFGAEAFVAGYWIVAVNVVVIGPWLAGAVVGTIAGGRFGN